MGKRTKQYKKLMRAFELLGFRQPYQLLVTSDVVMDTIKLDLVALFEKTLSTKNVKPMITQCCIVRLFFFFSLSLSRTLIVIDFFGGDWLLMMCFLLFLLLSEHCMQRMWGRIGTLQWWPPLTGQRRLRGGGAGISWTRIPSRSGSACCRLSTPRARARTSSDMWWSPRMSGWYVLVIVVVSFLSFFFFPRLTFGGAIEGSVTISGGYAADVRAAKRHGRFP